MGDSDSPVILALDTATRRASVACCEGAHTLSEAAREVTTHSEGLLALIDEVLGRAERTLAEIDVVVCGLGPGSFTGLRIGLATAKGLCLAGDRPLIGVCSLDALASATHAASGDVTVATLVNAGRGELFGRLYRGAAPLGDPWVSGADTLGERLASAAGELLLLAGNGASAWAERLRQLAPHGQLAPRGCHEIHARELAAAARARAQLARYDDLTACEPIYVRAPDIRPPAVPQTAGI